MTLDLILFYVFAALALACGLGVIAQRNPIYSAFSLIGVLCSLSAIYGLLGSPFIAILQIVVYAGAIMVLFLFVLMLLNVKEELHTADGGTLRFAAAVLVALLAGQLALVVVRAPLGAAPSFDASTVAVARLLFSARFLYVFEATSILILAALVGAVALSKRELE